MITSAPLRQIWQDVRNTFPDNPREFLLSFNEFIDFLYDEFIEFLRSIGTDDMTIVVHFPKKKIVQSVQMYLYYQGERFAYAELYDAIIIKKRSAVSNPLYKCFENMREYWEKLRDD
jgi:hypothetical protein